MRLPCLHGKVMKPAYGGYTASVRGFKLISACDGVCFSLFLHKQYAPEASEKDGLQSGIFFVFLINRQWPFFPVSFSY